MTSLPVPTCFDQSGQTTFLSNNVSCWKVPRGGDPNGWGLGVTSSSAGDPGRGGGGRGEGGGGRGREGAAYSAHSAQPAAGGAGMPASTHQALERDQIAFLRSLICTGARRDPATCGTHQAIEKTICSAYQGRCTLETCYWRAHCNRSF